MRIILQAPIDRLDEQLMNLALHIRYRLTLIKDRALNFDAGARQFIAAIVKFQHRTRRHRPRSVDGANIGRDIAAAPKECGRPGINRWRSAAASDEWQQRSAKQQRAGAAESKQWLFADGVARQDDARAAFVTPGE